MSLGLDLLGHYLWIGLAGSYGHAFGQEGIVTSNLFKGAIAHQVLYHRSKGIIYNLGWTDGWV